LGSGSAAVWEDEAAQDEQVVRIDPTTLAIAERFHVGGNVSAVAFGFKRDRTPINAPGRQYRTVIVRPSGAVTNTRTTPDTTSSRCGSRSPSQCVTDPAEILILADPTSSLSSTSAGSSRRCDIETAERRSASIGISASWPISRAWSQPPTGPLSVLP
jgi:hypothetical protein